MSVRIRIKGRNYTLSWAEFEKALANTGKGTCIKITGFVGSGGGAL